MSTSLRSQVRADLMVEQRELDRQLTQRLPDRDQQTVSVRARAATSSPALLSGRSANLLSYPDDREYRWYEIRIVWHPDNHSSQDGRSLS